MPRRRKDIYCVSCKNHLPEVAERHPLGAGKYTCRDCYLTLAAEYPGADAARLAREYKLLLKDHGAMFASQQGVCAICQRKRRLVVDHDHRTGLVRGLLCGNCNSGLGMFTDSVTSLAHAIAYLEKARATNIENHPRRRGGLRSVEEAG